MSLQERAPDFPPPPLRPLPGGSRPLLHLGLLLVTFFTTTVAGAYLAHFDYDLVRLWIHLKYHPNWIWPWLGDGLYFSAPLMAILVSHELGHYLVARHYRVNASLPYFLPAPNLVGTFGAVIVMKGRIPDRKALFDIGAAGPLMGLTVAVFTFFLGLSTAKFEPLLLPQGGVMFGANLLMYITIGLAGNFPDGIMLVSPLLDAACVGFLVTALNLFPLGQLDGGHIAHAAVGRHSFWLGILALAVMAMLGLLWPAWIVMGALFFLFMGRKGLRHPPPDDESSPLGPGRTALAVAILIILILILAPTPVDIWGPF